ncbi:hypothetical protein RCC89_08090 [Cytophagaceae bacterium ABcell3]|nr:hypothetical protein RCC89_08090 [Cytophagaceae bacterium ABcell3]
MEILNDLIKILLPAGVALLAIYFTVKAFLTKEFEKKLLDLKMNNSNTILPNRLQAYERICLLLERISPHNILLRVNDGSLNAGQLHQVLLHEIREEFNHNLSQQVYMSDRAWQVVRNTKDEIVGVVNTAANNIPKDAKGIELAKKIIEVYTSKEHDPVAGALSFVKDEVRKIF